MVYGYSLSCPCSLQKVPSLFQLSAYAVLNDMVTAVLVLRIWYLYRHSTLARALAMFCFVACAMACVMTLYFTGEEIKGIDINATYKLDLDIVGCIVTPPRDLWKVFAPVLVLHTILYLFTAYRGLHHRSVVAEPAPVMARLVRE